MKQPDSSGISNSAVTSEVAMAIAGAALMTGQQWQQQAKSIIKIKNNNQLATITMVPAQEAALAVALKTLQCMNTKCDSKSSSIGTCNSHKK